MSRDWFLHWGWSLPNAPPGPQDWICLEEWRKDRSRCITDYSDVAHIRLKPLAEGCEIVAPVDPWVYNIDQRQTIRPHNAFFSEAQDEQHFFVDLDTVKSGDALVNIQCRDAPLWLFLNGNFCCVITKQTVVPYVLMPWFHVRIRAVMSSESARRPAKLVIQVDEEHWPDDRFELAKANSVDCGTFTLHPGTQTFTPW